MSTLWQDIKTQFINSPSIVVRIIFINVAVFVLAALINQILLLSNSMQASSFIRDYFAISPNIHTLITRPWTIITYGFLHFEFFHILFNMLALFWFGIIFTVFLGNKNILTFFLMGLIWAGILFVTLYNLIPVFQTGVETAYMVGASAGILAVIVATATLLPDYTVFLILIGPVKIKWIALTLVILDLISINPMTNGGGHIAHLGGAIMGYVYIKQLQAGTDLGKGINSFFDWVATLFSSRKKIKVVSSNLSSAGAKKKTAPADTKHQEKLDIILDKISQSGYESLSKEEKDFLFSYSNKGR